MKVNSFPATFFAHASPVLVPLRTDRQPVDVKIAAAEIGQVAKDRGLKVVFTAGEAPRNRLSSARREGLSLNRFILKEEASRAGVILEPDYAEEIPLVELMEDAGVPFEGEESTGPAEPEAGQEESPPANRSPPQRKSLMRILN